MENNQYINNSNDKEEQQGFNKTGRLLLKNITDKIEYCLYNNKLPYPVCVESVDLNETLSIYLYSTIKQPIHITIYGLEGIIFSGTGRLTREFVSGVEKFYLDTIDLENILFENTDFENKKKLITVKINVMRDFVAENEGENKEDEPDEIRKKS